MAGTCATLLALAVGIQPAHAQVTPSQYIAINPIGIVFELFSGEFERRLNPTASFGISSTYWGPNFRGDDGSADISYWSIDGKLRYYPAGRALEGLALGGLLGFTTLSGTLTDDSGRATDRGNAVSIGVVLDYNWLLGQQNRFLIGTGIGAKRLFALNVDESDVTVAYPTFRLSVGYAF
jgi:hypothetical protein